MLDLVNIGKKIAKRRKECSYTQEELAQKLFVTHQAVSKWENGKSIPTIDILVSLTRLLEISIDYLLDHSEVDERNYELMFKNYSRATVFNHIMSNIDTLNPTDILYLLSDDERKQYITRLTKSIDSKTMNQCWPYFTYEERLMILSLLSKEDKTIMIDSHLLSNGERKILNNQNYKLGGK